MSIFNLLWRTAFNFWSSPLSSDIGASAASAEVETSADSVAGSGAATPCGASSALISANFSGDVAVSAMENSNPSFARDVK